MGLIKHNCLNCRSDLAFPEQVERINCPHCGSRFIVETFENIVSLKRSKEEPPVVNDNEATSYAETWPDQNFDESLELIDKQIYRLNRQLSQHRYSAFSSLSVSFLFFFFTLVWLLAGRDMIALFCGTITAAMTLVAGFSLRDSARLRSSLTLLLSRREQLHRRLNPRITKVF
ncbi:MAG: hypothetical protein AB1489_41950 [Acidobacteriota bacterium]